MEKDNEEHASSEVISRLSYTHETQMTFNIMFGLNGIAEDLYLHILHEMDDPQDIIQFLLTNRTISRSLSNKLLPWAESQSAALFYPLLTVPENRIILVCFF